MKLVNLDTGECLAQHVTEARSFVKRLKGLMFTKRMPAGSALHIKPCRSVHTCFMKYAIDIVHLDKQQRIVGIERNVTPWTLGKRFEGTDSVVELPEGALYESVTEVGQAVQITN